jgi:hypothetical protein
MKRFIEGEERGQGTLFPDRLDDWIGEDNPVRVVDIFVEELDSGDLGFDRIAPRATGWPGYHPSVLLKLYIYGYLTHVIFQDLDWVPANHAQAEDRCYRLGQDKRVTVEYFHAAGTLDGYIAELLQQKMALIAAVEAEDVPDTSLLADIQDGLRRLAPALMEEARAARATGDAATRLDQLSKRLQKQRLPMRPCWRLAAGSSRVPATRRRLIRSRSDGPVDELPGAEQLEGAGESFTKWHGLEVRPFAGRIEQVLATRNLGFQILSTIARGPELFLDNALLFCV